MPQLLDLPTEIFQHIMAVLVKKHGLPEAWKARGTSQTFRRYIIYEILANLSLHDYNSTRVGREILKNYLADFLFLRSSTLNGFVRHHVPEFIRDVMLALGPWVTDDEASTSLRKALCELFVRNHRDALRAVTTDINSMGSHLQQTILSTDIGNQVAAAAATGSVAALRHFASAKRHMLWSLSPSFGYPLEVAVYARQTAVVHAIAQQAITNQSQEFAESSYTEHLSFRKAICTAIELGENDKVGYLLKTYNDAFGPATEACMRAWLDTAIVSDDEHALKLLLTIPTQSGLSTIYVTFELACHLAKPALLHVLFTPHADRTTLSINHIQDNTYPLFTALDSAATPQSVIFVKELLKLGAGPNGPAYLSGLDRPLRAATRYGNRDVACVALLEAGANPYLVAGSGWVNSVKRMYGTETETGRAFRKALMECEKPRVAGDEDFLVEVKEEVKDGQSDGVDEMLMYFFF